MIDIKTAGKTELDQFIPKTENELKALAESLIFARTRRKEIKEREEAEAIEEIRRKMAELNIPLSRIGTPKKTKPNGERPLQPAVTGAMYRNPENKSETHRFGNGRPPKWFDERRKAFTLPPAEVEIEQRKAG